MHQNKLQENMDDFSQIISRGWLQQMPIVLIFTKLNIFMQKFAATPLSTYFEEYLENGSEGHNAVDFVTGCFLKHIPQHHETYIRKLNVLDANCPQDIIKCGAR